MEFVVHSHRHALELLNEVDDYKPLWAEVVQAIESLSDKRVMEHFEENFVAKGKAAKSLSRSINTLLDQELSSMHWKSQSGIFAESDYMDHTWRLDFAKSIGALDHQGTGNRVTEGGISIEVAFNHAGNISWNLIKPVIASEINHVEKAIQTSLGIVIAATEDLKLTGGFDGAVGTYENYVSNLLPLRNLLTVPIAVIGLEPFKSFHIEHTKTGNQKFGKVIRH
jgi:hypothetical protein